ncbi:MAG: DUF3185 domain-containing protein [Gemmatimonadaceae bacterium]|nr:hypothetical protein [Gemmatimonadaceae bacterium]
MKPISWLGVLLMVVGVVLLAMRISYTKDSETVTVGPVEVVTKRKAEIPPIVGVLLLVGGGALLVVGARRS